MPLAMRTASSTSFTGSGEPCATGTPASIASLRAAALSPISRMEEASGPT